MLPAGHENHPTGLSNVSTSRKVLQTHAKIVPASPRITLWEAHLRLPSDSGMGETEMPHDTMNP